MAKRVVLAMSGGVDSSVAAHLLKEQGHEVIGLFMRTGAHAEDAERRAKTCCSATDAVDARRVADRLDIPFYALDFERDFAPDHGPVRRRVRRRPDAEPVRHVQHLAQVRQALGVRQAGRGRLRGDRPLRPDRPRGRRDAPGRPRPSTAPRTSPTSSSASRRELLPHVLFPVGELSQGRDPARSPASWACRSTTSPTARRSASSPTTTTSASSASVGPERDTSGPIVDEDGTVLGTHAGIEGFTIGQRRGLGIAVGAPRYVVQIEPTIRTVTVGRRESLEKPGLEASRFNWQAKIPTAPSRASPRSAPSIGRCRPPVEPLADQGTRSSSRPPSRPSPPVRSSPSTRTTWSSAAAGSNGRWTWILE